MELPVHVLPVLEQWDCHSCGICCKSHTVFLDDEDLARLRQQHWDRHPDYEGIRTVVQLGILRSQSVLAQREDGSCVFLTDEGLCRIHQEHGEPAKPWACRMFPFQLVPAEDHVNLTMRRSCPSAAANDGRKLSEHLPAILPLAEKALPKGARVSPPSIVWGSKKNWQDAQKVSGAIARIMLDTDLPLVRRIVHALRFCDLLAECKPSRLQGESLRDLLDVFVESSVGGRGEAFRDRRAPSRSAAVLFRQAAAEYARHHPNLGDRPSLTMRFFLFRAAIGIARGKGKLPRIHASLPETTFETLETPLGNLAPDVMKPISSFFEAMAASLQYCGAGRFGWSIVDGFRALALAYPISLWLLRWLATERTPTPLDAIGVVCMLDRSHFYPLLGGYRHRKRLEILTRLEELERLIVWYAR